MARLIKKENISVVIGEYPDPQNPQVMKKKYRAIGELVTMQGDDGSVYQFGEIWGPHGSTKINIYEQDNQNQQAAPPQGYQQAPQQQPHYGNQQAPHQHPPGMPPQGGYGGRRG